MLWAFVKRHSRGLAVLAILLVGVLLAGWFVHRPRPAAEGRPRVLILGLDGLDPQLLDQYIGPIVLGVQGGVKAQLFGWGAKYRPFTP